HQHDDRNLSLWIDPEMGVVDACPAVAARCASMKQRRGRGKLEPQAPGVAKAPVIVRSAERKRLADRDVRGRLPTDDQLTDLVPRHVADWRLRNKPPGPGAAAIQE